MSTRTVVIILLGMATLIAGISAMLWTAGWLADAITYAVMFGTVWIVLAGLCVWAWNLGR